LSPVFTEDMNLISFGLANGGQCKTTRDRPSAPLSGDGAQISLTQSHLQFFSYNFLACTECYPNILCNLSDRRHSVHMISRTCAMVSVVWEVDGLPGWGSSSKDWRPLLKREYHSNVFDQPTQDSPKAACSISYVSAPVFLRRKQKLMPTRC